MDVLDDPTELLQAAHLFGYGSATGIDLPGEAKGKLPTDVKQNRTGLYASAIGQHTLLCTPLQTAVALSAIANKGIILSPTIAKTVEGAVPNPEPWHLLSPNSRRTRAELLQLGIDFPLFTAAISRDEKPIVQHLEPNVVRVINLPDSVRSSLIEGMDRAVWNSKGTARPGAIKGLKYNPALLSQYLSLKHQMVGKTSTAEILFNPNISPSSKASLYKHIWFGAIGFNPHAPEFEDPEIVIVVYLRYGDGGKEAAPLASQMIAKWREIQKAHSGTSS